MAQLVIDITTDTTGAKAGIRYIIARLKTLGEKADDCGRRVETVGTSFVTAAKTANKGADDFEKGLGKVFRAIKALDGKGIQQAENAATSFSKMAQALAKIGEIKPQSITAAKNSLAKLIPVAKDLASASEGLVGFASAMQAIPESFKAFTGSEAPAGAKLTKKGKELLKPKINVESIEKVAAPLSNIANSLGRISDEHIVMAISNTADAIGELGSALNALGSSASKVSELASGLRRLPEALQGFTRGGHARDFTAQINAVQTALQKFSAAITKDVLPPDLANSIYKLGDGLKSLSKAGANSNTAANLSASADALRKFSEAFAGVETGSLSSVADAVKASASAIEKLGSVQGGKALSGKLASTASSINDFVDSLSGTDVGILPSVGASLREVANAVARLGRVATAASGSGLSAVSKSIRTFVNALSGINMSQIPAVGEALRGIANAIARLNAVSGDGTMSANLAAAAAMLKTFVNSLSGIDIAKLPEIGASIRDIANALSRLGRVTADNIGAGLSAAAKSLKSFINSLSGLDLTKLPGVGEAMRNLANAISRLNIVAGNGTLSANLATAATAMQNFVSSLTSIPDSAIAKLERLGEAAAKITSSMYGAGQAARSAASAVKAVGKEAQSAGEMAGAGAKGGFAKLIEAFARVARYYFLRMVLRKIMQAIKEGLDNLYEFSKANSDFGGISSAFNGLASAAQKMKNQLGATFGQMLSAASPFLIALMNLVTKLTELLYPLVHVISALEPVITAIVNVVTDLVNVLISLFDLLGFNVGKIVAQDAAKEWGEANNAAKEYKNTILGFDEINRLNDQNGSGGGAFKFTDNLKLSYDKDNNPFDFIIWKIDDTKKALGELAAVPVPEMELELDVDDKATEKLDGIVQRVKDDFPIYATVVMAIEGNPIPFIKMVRSAIKNYVRDSIGTLKQMETAYASASASVAADSYSLAGKLKTAFASNTKTVNDWQTEYENSVNSVQVENATLGEDVKDTFNRLKNPLNDWVSHVWQKIGEYQQAGSALQVENATLTNDLKTTLDGAKANINTFVTQTLPQWGAWAENVARNAQAAFNNVAQNVYIGLSNAAQNIATFINSSASNVATWVNNTASNFANWASNVAQNVGRAISSAWDNFKNFMSATGQAISGWWNENKAWAIPAVTVAGVVTAAIALAPVTGGASLAGLALAANGGTFDEGQLFIAREAGPELVGSIGGHTAVVNNDQIVEAVSAGVFNAVSSAMSGSNGEKYELHVYLDSKEIKYGQTRLARAMGV